MTDYEEYSPVVMRILLGILFLLPGYGKLMSLFTTGDHMVSGMLWGSVALAWVLALVEVCCGLGLILGYKTKYVAWPLVIVILGAGFMTIDTSNMMWQITLLFHLVTAAALAHVGTNGPGPMALDK